MAKFAKIIQKIYPRSRIRMNVTHGGVQAYQIEVSIINPQSEILHRMDYYGVGNLRKLKKEALRQLAKSLAVSVK